jgi:translation initiation factor 2 beta subunit (eIF-2beta)/eIF-5
MALKCASCRSTDVTVLGGDEVSCLKCGEHGDHAHAGRQATVEPAAETPEPPASKVKRGSK